MFDMAGIQIVLFMAALQAAGAVMGAFQGYMTARIARIGPDRRVRATQVRATMFSGFARRAFGFVATLLLVLTVLGLLGAATPIVIVFVAANGVLPILGSLIFAVPAWICCSDLFARRAQSVDAAA